MSKEAWSDRELTETETSIALWLLGIIVVISLLFNFLYTIFIGPIPTDYPSGDWPTPTLVCEVQQCP